MSYCLWQLYDDDVFWTKIPKNCMPPKVGDESVGKHNHFCVEGGVAIAIIDEKSPAGQMIAYIDNLDRLAQEHGNRDMESPFMKMLVELLTVAAKGARDTELPRAEVKAFFEKNAA